MLVTIFRDMYKYKVVMRHVHQNHYSLSLRFLSKWSKGLFKFSDEVADSLSKGLPVVALESTVISHGLPYPDNLRTACKMEEIVRENKATPATIGVIGGNIHIGMQKSHLEALSEKNENLVKISRRDLPYVMSKGLSGGTTVAATMVLAYRAGIPIFVTGGIGGVHRGAETSMDISADLYELAHTPMTVISAGVKSILDIGRTLEYLETLGVCVAAFGPSRDFPSFFTPKSKFLAPSNVESYAEAARLIDSRDQLQLESGVLLAVPIPDEFHEDGYRTEGVIEDALKEARSKNILGRDVTPFVLSKVRELSTGASLKANIGLLENNAKVGSQIAVHLSVLQKQRTGGSVSPRVMMVPVRHEAKDAFSSCGRPVVIGGSILDIHVKALKDVKMDGRTLVGKVESIAGGVGRNLADCLTRLHINPFLISAVGAQEHAHSLLNKMDHMDTSGIKIVPDARTATCVVVLDNRGECLFLIGDMGVHSFISSEQVESHKSLISTAPLVVLDGNVSMKTMDYIFHLCSDNKIPVWFEPTDLSFAFRPFKASPKWKSVLSYASPNLNELRIMHNTVFGKEFPLSNGTEEDLKAVLEESLFLGVPLLDGQLHTLVVTLGPHGVLLITKIPSESGFPTVLENSLKFQNKVKAVHYPALKSEKIVSVSGAGDCFAAGMIGSILRGLDSHECVLAGQKAATLSLSSHWAVPNSICPEAVFTADEPAAKTKFSVIL